ncbi:uncharacterized protein LOC124953590 isoform X2 [Vespa velutina]|uniref:uncharacterized protein LOC124953590 isoform X2 n=2 Tax=Vespa velutina TaxID=202808 RepID=UPI001FB1BDF3|nr:uncharacterized protein LOC124953590 isoform X2 [Vespa velutina]XP_047361122.1 uncharacterized protein LOC124953590 isoform X2 [Vespa velutina]
MEHSKTRFFLLLLILCAIVVAYSDPEIVKRTTRILAFRKGSTFFYRMNYKITSFPKRTTIFAQAAGFKVAWELPTSNFLDNRVGRSLSDVHESAKLVYESHGFNGHSCLLKNICHILEYVKWKDGVMAKILKLFVGPYINNDTSTDASPDFCRVHLENCPLEFQGVNAFSERTSEPSSRN